MLTNNRQDKVSMIEVEMLAIALGKKALFSTNPTYEDWNRLFKFATNHCIVGLLFTAIERLSNEQKPSRSLLFEWGGSMMFYEHRYIKHQQAIAHLASFYRGHGISTMILKGYGLSTYWPIPCRRAMGDIDTYNFGKWQMADTYLTQELGIRVDDSHEHHTVFTYEGCMVENHYDIVNSKAFRDAARMDSVLKELAQENRKSYSVDGSQVYFPSPTFNAVFLIRHLGQHFGSVRINMCQLLDWAFFLQHEHGNINWNKVFDVYKEFGLRTFFNYINSICVDYLGFDLFKDCEWYDDSGIDASLSKRMWEDIISPEFVSKKPKGNVLVVIAFKLRRFFANRWKRRMISKENLLTMFLYGSIAHIKRFLQ